MDQLSETGISAFEIAEVKNYFLLSFKPLKKNIYFFFLAPIVNWKEEK